MAANFQIYTDAECITEITKVDGIYSMRLGQITGLNGTDGEVLTTSVYIKNTGTVKISNMYLIESVDNYNQGSYSLDDITYNDSNLNIGEMLPEAIVRVYVKLTIPEGTAPANDVPLNFKVTGTHLSY